MIEPTDMQARLAARGEARFVAPPNLLTEAFPVPPAATLRSAPILVTGLAAAAAAVAPLVTVNSDPAFDRTAASVAFDVAKALAAEAAR